jgi:hypothetical protein
MIRKAKLLSLLFLVHTAVCYSQTASSLTLAWDASPSPSVSGYFLYTVDAGNSQTVKTDAGNTTTATINSLISGHKYSIRVTAYDSSKNESGPSNVLVVTAPSVAGFPTPPESSLSIDSRGLLWIKGAPGIMYGIQASSDLKNWTEIGQVKGASNLVPFFDGAVATGQTRFYRVAAK